MKVDLLAVGGGFAVLVAANVRPSSITAESAAAAR